MEKAVTHTAPLPGSKPPGKPAPTGKPSSAHAKPAPAPQRRAEKQRRTERQSRTETGAEAEPRPRGPVRARDDGPSLRPLDRELVRNWLMANPEWRPSGRPLPVGEGRPMPPGLPRQPLPPELAMLLPYFPGFRYAAVGPDLVLYATGSEVVASLLAGALAR
jgi:hypothetical protein